MYLNRGATYSYYVIGHAVSDEKYVRAKEFGGTGLTDHLLFYPLPRINRDKSFGSNFPVGPIFVLTLDTGKSPIVGGIVGAPNGSVG